MKKTSLSIIFEGVGVEEGVTHESAVYKMVAHRLPFPLQKTIGKLGTPVGNKNDAERLL